VLDTHQTHRLKFAEAIHAVSFHPTQPYLASAGADGIVKLYV
jgi:WD40 repeat protein